MRINSVMSYQANNRLLDCRTRKMTPPQSFNPQFKGDDDIWAGGDPEMAPTGNSYTLGELFSKKQPETKIQPVDKESPYYKVFQQVLDEVDEMIANEENPDNSEE